MRNFVANSRKLSSAILGNRTAICSKPSFSALVHPDADLAFAAHVSPHYDIGTYAIQEGPVTANPDFSISKLFGKEAHGSKSYRAVDDINMGSKVYEPLQTFLRQISNSHQEIVLSVCTFHSGTASAAIPGACELRGTVRSFDVAVQLIEECAKTVSKLYGGRYELDYYISCFPTVNDISSGSRKELRSGSCFAHTRYFISPPCVLLRPIHKRLLWGPPCCRLSAPGSPARVSAHPLWTVICPVS